MVRLGEFKKEKQKLTFKEWVDTYKREGIYRVMVLFPPSRYPSYTLIFEDGDFEVRLSLKSEKFKDALKALGLSIGKRNIPSLLLLVDNSGYSLDVDVDNPFKLLVWKGNYWRFEDTNVQDDDSITF